MGKKIGFTGTQEGMTKEQKESVVRLIGQLRPSEIHHGDCIGADAQFHNIGKQFTKKIVKHPGHPRNDPDDDSRRAYSKGGKTLPPKEFIARNDDIIAASDVIIATPKEFKEVQRSGTWTTIRHAEKAKKKVYKVFPDGKVK